MPEKITAIENERKITAEIVVTVLSGLFSSYVELISPLEISMERIRK